MTHLFSAQSGFPIPTATLVEPRVTLPPSFEPHKDPVRCRIEWHVAVALHEDREGRCRVGVDLSS